MNMLSCQVQLDAISIAVAPITAAARSQRLGDITLPLTSPTSIVTTIIVP
jgi:ABC-type sugar transport system permease subunit